MTFIDLSYYPLLTADPESLLLDHRPNLGYIDYLPVDWECAVVKFTGREGHNKQPRFDYYFFRGRKSKAWIPITADRFIASLKPDMVMVHGLIFPHQLLALRALLPRKSKIIVQHHAERPGNGIKRRLQKIANRFTSAYLFSNIELAQPWIDQGIIDKEKVFEVMEGSSDFQQISKASAREALELKDGPVFLWVGRLDRNKDPGTVLKGFEKFLLSQPSARLYMIYQTNDLLKEVSQIIGNSAVLKNVVVLKGIIEKSQLVYWYSAADYYVSGSHSEGSGYALIEAMSCGCIPIVTNIPSFRKITQNGKAGFLFEPGNPDSFSETLLRMHSIPKDEIIQKVKHQFKNELSFEAIARQLIYACTHLNSK